MKRMMFVLLLALMLGAGAGIVFASGGTQELWPTYRLVDNGKERGVVYALDGGWLILTDEDTLYVCGCEVGLCEVTATNPQEPTADKPPTNTAPTDEPASTPVPTDEPTKTPKPHCDQGRSDDDECSPGNSNHNHGDNDPQQGPRK
jgi:hypothetical protein